MINDDGNIIVILVRCPPQVLTNTDICCIVKTFTLTPVKTILKDGLHRGYFEFFSHDIYLHLIVWRNERCSCLDTISILFVQDREMLAMEGKSILPMHMAILCKKEEVNVHQNRLI